jgi:hypothetical protein
MLRPVAVAALAATIALTAASSPAATAPAVMTHAGIGPIKIGASAASLQKAGLIGKLRLGCELNVPRGYFANTKQGTTFTGSVGFDAKKRVTSVSAWKGAVDRYGLTVGATDQQVLARYSFSVDPKSKKVIELDNPYAMVCE